MTENQTSEILKNCCPDGSWEKYPPACLCSDTQNHKNGLGMSYKCGAPPLRRRRSRVYENFIIRIV